MTVLIQMIKTDSNIRKSYKLYKQSYTKQNMHLALDSKTYIDIANNYNKFLFEKVLAGEEITLPAKMGTLYIIGSKQKIKFDENGVPLLPPDWAKTIEYWKKHPEAKENKKVIYCTNEHTNGVRYKILWSKKRIMVENKTLYSLRLTRTNKRFINASIKKGKEYLIKT